MNILSILTNFIKNSKKEVNKVSYNFNNLPDGVFTLELDGKIIDVNDKALEMYNATRFNILGRYFSEFVEGGSAILNKAIENNCAICAKAKFEDISENKPKEDKYFEFSASKSPETQKAFVIVRDVTNAHKEQNIINEKYTVAKKIIDGKNDFLIASSGTILSTLVSISGFSRALLDGMGGPLSDKQNKYLNIINSSSKDLNYDLEKLFALFKLESRQTKYNFKVFDLISMIKSIERVYQKDIKDKNLQFSLDYESLYRRDCYLDGEIIEYILRCIMDIFLRFGEMGACSFNIGHPPIEFLKTKDFESKEDVDLDNLNEARIRQITENYALFEAKLQDLVFAPEELENIFDSYYKGQTKRPIGLKATLNLLKQYITDFKGDIWIYSKSGFGTMITFVLPLTPIEEAKKEPQTTLKLNEDALVGLDTLYSETNPNIIQIENELTEKIEKSGEKGEF